MAHSQKLIPSFVKPCIIALVQSRDNVLSAMAVTWFAQVGHKPELLQVAINKSHHTHKVMLEQGWLVLAFATPALQEVFNELGTITSNDPAVDKFKALKQHKVEVAQTEAGQLWLPSARTNLLCQVAVMFGTKDGYSIVSCRPVANLGGLPGPQLYYAGKVDGARQYLGMPS